MSCQYVGGACAGPNVPIPLWRIKLNGKDDKGAPVNAVIDLSLPAEPASIAPVSSAGVRAISLTPARR